MSVLNIKVCETCKGDGFHRVKINDVHPMMNVANARGVLPSGKEVRFPFTGVYGQLTHFVFTCSACTGLGEIE